jgi:hypothetical protein
MRVFIKTSLYHMYSHACMLQVSTFSTVLFNKSASDAFNAQVSLFGAVGGIRHKEEAVNKLSGASPLFAVHKGRGLVWQFKN